MRRAHPELADGEEPRRGRVGIWIAVAVAVAMLAGGGWWLLGGAERPEARPTASSSMPDPPPDPGTTVPPPGPVEVRGTRVVVAPAEPVAPADGPPDHPPAPPSLTS